MTGKYWLRLPTHKQNHFWLSASFCHELIREFCCSVGHIQLPGGITIILYLLSVLLALIVHERTAAEAVFPLHLLEWAHPTVIDVRVCRVADGRKLLQATRFVSFQCAPDRALSAAFPLHPSLPQIFPSFHPCPAFLSTLLTFSSRDWTSRVSRRCIPKLRWCAGERRKP